MHNTISGFAANASLSRDKARFTLKLLYIPAKGGPPHFQLQQLAISPARVTCLGHEEAASFAQPIEIDGSRTIVCENPSPEVSVIIGVNTTVGSSTGPDGDGKIELAGTRETLQDIQDRLTKLEQYSVPKGTIAYFNTEDCPQGWTRADILTGRYAVGVSPSARNDVGKQVGQALENLEDRATGAHTHAFNYIATAYGFGNSFETCKTCGGGGTHVAEPSTSQVPVGSKPGTNAPFAQLSACLKL